MRIKIIISIILISTVFPVFVMGQENPDLPNPGLTPDSPFYFFDTIGKKINLFFIFSPEKKAEKAIQFAEERLAEAKIMGENNKTKALASANQAYQEFVDLANQKTKEAKEQGKDVEELAVLITEKTLRHQEILTEVFEKVPEEAKAAIESAIQASRRGSEEAVQAVTGTKKDELLQKIEETRIRVEERMGALEEKIKSLEERLEEEVTKAEAEKNKAETEIERLKKEAEAAKEETERARLIAEAEEAKTEVEEARIEAEKAKAEVERLRKETKADEPELEAEEKQEPDGEVGLCNNVNCDKFNGWYDSESIFTCQNEDNKTCTCQAREYRDYSCSDLNGKCTHSITDTKIYKYNCRTPEPEPEPEPEIIEVPGCTDSTALNYDSEATANDDSCLYPEPEPDPNKAHNLELYLLKGTSNIYPELFSYDPITGERLGLKSDWRSVVQSQLASTTIIGSGSGGANILLYIENSEGEGIPHKSNLVKVNGTDRSWPGTTNEYGFDTSLGIGFNKPGTYTITASSDELTQQATITIGIDSYYDVDVPTVKLSSNSPSGSIIRSENQGLAFFDVLLPVSFWDEIPISISYVEITPIGTNISENSIRLTVRDQHRWVASEENSWFNFEGQRFSKRIQIVVNGDIDFGETNLGTASWQIRLDSIEAVNADTGMPISFDGLPIYANELVIE